MGAMQLSPQRSCFSWYLSSSASHGPICDFAELSLRLPLKSSRKLNNT